MNLVSWASGSGLQKPRAVARLSARFSIAEPFTKPVADIERQILLQNSKPDVVFLIQGQKVYGHKYMLARHSPVFDSLIKREHFLANNNDAMIEIEITDSFPHIFELMLTGMYEGSQIFCSKSILECLDAFFMAHKYNIRKLEVSILKILFKNVDAKSALAVLMHPSCKLGIIPSLKSKCWSLLEQNTLQIVKSKEFLEIDWILLVEILSNSRLTLPEYALIRRSWDWCYFQKKKLNNKTLIEILGTAVYLLRFKTLTPEQLKLVCNFGILKEGEKRTLITNIKSNTTFIGVKRSNRCKCQKDACRLCNSDPRYLRMVYDSGPTPRVSISSDLSRDLTRATRSNTCECIKYLSCPRFPNGATFRIMQLRNCLNSFL